MPERRTASHTVAAILRLRRLAEREARRELEGARSLLERARRRELLCAERLRQAEQALGARRSKGPPPLQSAARLQLERGALDALREEARRARAELDGAAQGREAALRQVEQAREGLLLSIARREAAELHEATERRDRARYRARRAAALEEELAGRQAGRSRRPGGGG